MYRFNKPFRLLLAILLISQLVLPPALCAEQAYIPGFYGSIPVEVLPQTLPVIRSVIQGADVLPTDGSKLTIRQTESKAIIEWESFNIGKDTWTHFEQESTDWEALNRIYDLNPSLIFGKLTAKGKVYLVNQNGTLFGPDSQVQVHSLISSSLNLRNNDFLNDQISLYSENYNSVADPGFTQPGVVANHGTMVSDTQGSVFLVAPRVENSGTIITPSGQSGLIAGSEVELYADESGSRSALVAHVKQLPDAESEYRCDDGAKFAAGEAVNYETGAIAANTGLAGMYGRIVNQEGLIQSVTAIKSNGQIELVASDRVVTGVNSLTVSSISTSNEAEHESFEFAGGEIRIHGLDTSDPLDADAPVTLIEHNGIIAAPSGNISMAAGERIYLASGSRVDVSGTEVTLPAETNLVEVQLNSVELKNDYGQKDGMLQGETISLLTYDGSAIGDVSGSLSAEERTALERSSVGGTIMLKAEEGEVIVKSDAVLDFSGGGVNYLEGYVNTTKLVSGNTVYDISEAPQYVKYDALIGEYEKVYERYDVVENYSGLYMGGANAVTEYASSYYEGSDAGTLVFRTRGVLMDGTLDGSVNFGTYQLQAMGSDDESGSQPSGGHLLIGEAPAGNVSYEQRDLITNEIVVQAESTPLPQSFGPDDALPDHYFKASSGHLITMLPADTISAAGLSQLSLYTNAQLTIEKGASISLLPNGSFTATTRSILNEGSIYVPAGSILLNLDENVSGVQQISNQDNPLYIPVNERIYLSGGSVLDASGQTINNYGIDASSNRTLEYGDTDGGEIAIMDKIDGADGVILRDGSQIHVDGGYTIDPDGSIQGGDAGSLTIQGSSIVLDGTLTGFAYVGSNSGALTLHAENVVIGTDTTDTLSEVFNFGSDLPTTLANRLVLNDNRLDQTGFAEIEIKSKNDLIVSSGVSLSPSAYQWVVSSSTTLEENDPTQFIIDTVPTGAEYQRRSSIILTAGERFTGSDEDPNLTAQAIIESGARLESFALGEIILSGPSVEVYGDLNAPAGTIDMIATVADVHVHGGSKLSAAGFNRPNQTSMANNLPVGSTPLAAGTISLEAEFGDLIIDTGSFIDLSGSYPIAYTMAGENLDYTIRTVASAPGTLELIYMNNLEMGADLAVHAYMDELPGAALAITRTNLNTGLTITAPQINDYLQAGFDDLAFISLNALVLSGDMDLRIGRQLTLDALTIVGQQADDVRLSAPSIRIVNSYWPTSVAPTEGNASLTLAADWIDIEGDLNLSSYAHVYLNAEQDLTLSDRYYMITGRTSEWAGGLQTEGDLTLHASRIYPTTASDFSITTPGLLTILSSGRASNDPIYSAGGRLTIEANKINHQGFIAAPMGQLVLNAVGADNRIYLAEGSTLSVSGSLPVNYGTMEESYWSISDKATNIDSEITAVPQKIIEINSDEIIVCEDALLDLSGGGSFFGYQYQAGVDGTVNPLDDVYVILPQYPNLKYGNAVYLEGGENIEAGTYVLLPAEYAFLPGAMVISPTDIDVANGIPAVTEEGFAMVAGYEVVLGTDMRSPQPQAFVVRTADEVLEEGYFNTAQLVSGDGGSISLAGETNIVNGTINAVGLQGFKGGDLYLSGQHITIGQNGATLPLGFDFESVLPQEMIGRLNITAESISNKGFESINIGDTTITQKLTVSSGSNLQANAIVLSAGDQITIEEDAKLHATGEVGNLSLVTPQGAITVAENSLLHASHELTLGTSKLDFHGDIQIDNSSLILGADRIFLLGNGYSESDFNGYEGFYIDESIWELFASVENIQLESRSDLIFLGDFNWQLPDALTLSAEFIGGIEGNGSNVVQLNANQLNILGVSTNSTASELSSYFDSTTGSMTLDADVIHVGHGETQLVGFNEIMLSSDSDLVFMGEGSLTVDGNLTLKAANVTATYYSDDDISYEASDFRIEATDRQLTLMKSASALAAIKGLGGHLEFVAGSIDHQGSIVMPSGYVAMTATGSGDDQGIFLRSGSEVRVAGGATTYIMGSETHTDIQQGGTVVLTAEGGRIEIEGAAGNATAAIVDVSNTTTTDDVGSISQEDAEELLTSKRLDAGTLSITAPLFGAKMDGVFLGYAGSIDDQDGHTHSGTGASFFMNTDQLDTVDDLNRFSITNTLLKNSGFSGDVTLRAHNGNVVIDQSDEVIAKSFQLLVDGGGISHAGLIDVSGLYVGGDVTLISDQRVELKSGSQIAAMGLGGDADGGNVSISSANGAISLTETTIDVSANGSAATGGTVAFRVPRSAGNDDINLSLSGTINGASKVTVEGVRTYSYSGNRTFDANSTEVQQWKSEANEFMTYSATIETALVDNNTNLVINWDKGGPDGFYLLPGIEARTTGDMTIGSPDIESDVSWDLTTWRYNGTPGVLTLRAGNNLTVSDSIVDHPTSLNQLASSTIIDSWALNLVAGADFSSASYQATANNKGDFTIANGRMVYSESAPIFFASGNDTTIGQANPNGYMIKDAIRYSLGSYDGKISGAVGGDLTLAGGIIQSATADIDIVVGGDLLMTIEQDYGSVGSFTSLGSIRTTGESPASPSGMSDYWTYTNGGDIRLHIGGDVDSQLTYFDAWDYYYKRRVPYEWAASYENSNATEGIATMGGGDVELVAGGDFYGQIGTFAEGDLYISAGGDINARVLINDGQATLMATGSYGNCISDLAIEVFDATVDLTAFGSIQLGTLLNPTIAREKFTSRWNLTYSQDSKAELAALTGDVSLSGTSVFYNTSSDDSSRERVLPPTVKIYAGSDIKLSNRYALSPSPTGNLVLAAAGSIDGFYTSQQAGITLLERSSIVVSDMDPAFAYGDQGVTDVTIDLFDRYEHATLHGGDDQPVVITAGVDISNLAIFSPKQTEILAGQDIEDIFLLGQNLAAGETTCVIAGRDIIFGTIPDTTTQYGIINGGPGFLTVQAGRSIDLGISDGIQSVGNQFNFDLPDTGNIITVASGYPITIDQSELDSFFESLRIQGTEYSNFLADGEIELAETILEEIRSQTIASLFSSSSEPAVAVNPDVPVQNYSMDAAYGNIEMVNSQINTSSGSDDIFILAKGSINVGRSTFFENESQRKATGIFTASGGSINIFAEEDINVNESRVMTFRGGDITIWSDQGDVNAGRGSKTAVSASPPKPVWVGDLLVIQFDPPAVGSGVRTLTYDPDGYEGPLEAPPAGDAYIFAPEGIIDAGEAGIAGTNVILGATKVLNAQNITVTGTSVGVPQTATGPSMGALVGAGTVSETSKITEESAAMRSAEERFSERVAELSDQLVPKWIAVEVIGFEEDKEDNQDI